MRRSRTLISTLALGLLVAGACGDDDGEGESIPMTGNRPTTTVEDTSDEGAFPVTIRGTNRSVEIAEQPTVIVSLSPTATEMLFAIGAGGQVVAVDEQSDFPEGTPITDLSGLQPDVEAIAGHEPDLVLTEGDNAVAELDALGIPVMQLPAATTLDESYAQIEQLGQATGHETEASELVDTMQADIQALVDAVPRTTADTSVYHELDSELFTATPNTFIGQIYELAGLRLVTDTLGGDQAYVQVSDDDVISANPTWIFLAYGGDSEVAEIAARPGWSAITAVQDNQVVALDPDIASRWGPRTVDFLRTVVETVYPAV